MKFDPDAVPDRDNVFAYLRTLELSTGRANVWATYLTGLPWKYLRPVATIAWNTGHQHPAMALAAAAANSDDIEFKAAASAHIEAAP